MELSKVVDETILSMEDAKQLALDYLRDLIKEDDFSVERTHYLVNSSNIETDDGAFHEVVNSINGYCFYITRIYSDVTTTLDFASGTNEDEGVGTIPFAYESIRIGVLGGKIYTLSIESRMETKEIITDQVQLMDYNDILQVFKQHILIKNADFEESGEKWEFNIDNIELGLMRIKNKDNQNEFTMIPVWDFYAKDFDTRMSLITINALDGSVINRAYGY